MEASEFQFAGRYQSVWHLGCMDWSVYLSPCHILSVHCFLEKYSVNNTLLVPSCVCQALLGFGIWEFFQCDLYGGSLDGGGADQRLFGLSANTPL